jgi:hypothetical protein
LKECLLQEKQKERRVGDSNDNMWTIIEEKMSIYKYAPKRFLYI